MCHMKISKEGHKRMSVTLKRNVKKNSADKAMGRIIPLKKGQKLEDHIQERVNNGKILYNILGPSAVSKTSKEEQSTINHFNEFMKKVILDNVNVKPSEKRVVNAIEYVKEKGSSIWVLETEEQKDKKEEKGKPEKKPLYTTSIDMNKERIHEFVPLHIRGSLKKRVKIEKDGQPVEVYIPDVIEELVFAVAHDAQFDTLIEEIDEEELAACFHAIFKDYTKEDEIPKMAKSIKNQDVKVQVLGSGETARLQLASADNDKKKYIFLFLEKFACAASEKERNDLLREFRELLVLFYCGTAAYEEIKERKNGIPIWDFDFLSKMVSDISWVFNQECSDKLIEREQIIEALRNEKDKNEKKQLKSKIKDIDTEVKGILEKQITERYREGAKVLQSSLEKEQYKEKRFWLEYIEMDAEKVLCSKKVLAEKKLDTVWLCNNTWRTFLSFLCMKAVDMGKAVYHFAMPDLEQLESGKTIKAGRIKPQFQQGLTSFDYERIKAEENLERSFMTGISFALNNFSSAVCPPEIYEKEGSEDILCMKDKIFREGMYPNASWRLMQYFGGVSQWKGSRFEKLSGFEETKEMNKKFVSEVKDAMRLIRNSAFHYAASAAQGTLDKNSYLVEIFEKEQENLGSKYRKKYVSNNVPMFYKVEDIDRLMKYLYRNQKVVESQIPSFRNVISRKSLPEVRAEFIDLDSYAPIQDSVEQAEKFNSSLYFVLKEIYYNGFLQEDNLLDRFMKIFEDELELERERKTKASKQNVRAMKNFGYRVHALQGRNEKLTFGELCQAIMTDYNMQNNQKKVRLNKKDNLPDEKYKHFKMLLLVCLRKAFIDYLENDIAGKKIGCGFLREPRLKTNIYDNLTEEQFCTGWKIDRYNNLVTLITEDGKYDSWLISWFIMAHFMTPKHLNHLRGEIKSYLSYVRNIEQRRCAATRVSGTEDKEKRQKYEQVLEILDLAAEYCGQISNERTDYYESEEEYARHISKYIAFADAKSSRPLEEQLHGFCNQKADGGPADRIGIFYDGENPILNRNVVLAKLYGTEKLLSECLQEERVTKTEIEEHYEHAKTLEDVFKYGGCKNKAQEEARRTYQQQKNRIELVDILKCSDLLNDFMSQLISWCYLRERDRMYFQIGLHYIRLYYGGNLVEKDSKFRVLQSKEAKAGEKKGINLVDGAILYQLAAIYTYEYPVYTLDEAGNAILSERAKKGSTTAAGVMAFCNEYCGEDKSTYEMGLSLFENPIEESELIGFRNYIDHFKYYSRRERSILDLYSQVFANYFRHDRKLKKSVTFIFKNILARHFIIARTVLDEVEVEKEDDRTKENNPIIRKYNQAVIQIPEENGLQSDVTLHKYTEEDIEDERKKKSSKDGKRGRMHNEGEKYHIPMYDERFIRRLYLILNYKK